MSRFGIPNRMNYYIPWWDDRVDLNYDFIEDEPTDGIKVTAHEIYSSPPYDGILVSKAKIEENKKNMKRITNVGIHEYLGFDGPVFGDCGAYGYIKEDVPPYKTKETAEYYHKLGFDYGVSVDHLIVKQFEEQKHNRYDITIKNAEKFLQVHDSKGFDYVPVGAAQGWDATSYKESVKELLDIGYQYIAIGGLTRSPTSTVLDMLRAIHEVLSEHERVGVHLFGVARLSAMREMQKLGITSFDSASHLRRAWLGSRSNYMLPDGNNYAAIRIPQSDRSPKAKKILGTGNIELEELEAMEEGCMGLMRMYGRNKADLDEVLEAILWYDSIIDAKKSHADEYLKTLKDRPWELCDCAICKRVGVEVIIFRGNNRNRRRGFHNTWVFYKQLQKILDEPDPVKQTTLGEF
ncbi:MAG: queuine/other tRNA-ribosyltransferase [Candidatus Lokiarchaeota archaeon]|nr:queuine/other tRNA-ribosyltransferase [Candidatus Lokiarchaeota archaeon]